MSKKDFCVKFKVPAKVPPNVLARVPPTVQSCGQSSVDTFVFKVKFLRQFKVPREVSPGVPNSNGSSAQSSTFKQKFPQVFTALSFEPLIELLLAL